MHTDHENDMAHISEVQKLKRNIYLNTRTSVAITYTLTQQKAKDINRE